eukprot:1371333-Amorphochlora_amoeboformis.AAC.1
MRDGSEVEEANVLMWSQMGQQLGIDMVWGGGMRGAREVLGTRRKERQRVCRVGRGGKEEGEFMLMFRAFERMGYTRSWNYSALTVLSGNARVLECMPLTQT